MLTTYYFLDFLYKRDVSTIYHYEGFNYEFSLTKLILGILIAASTALFIYAKKMSGFCYAVLGIFYVSLLLPNIILYQYMEDNFSIVASILFFMGCVVAFESLVLRIKIVKIAKNDQLIILTGIIFLLLIPFFFTFGFNPNWDIFKMGTEVYDVRLEAREKFNVVTAYTYNWLTNILLPMGLIFGILRKNKTIIIASLAGFLYLFLCNASKGVLFYVVLIVLFYFGSFPRKIFNYLLVTMATLLFAAYEQNIFVTGNLVNRPFFGPAYLSSCYFELFAGKPIYLSSSILSRFIEYPYSLYPANLIGSEYFNSPKMNANSGIPADGFMNFGFFGVGLFSVVEALIFAYIASLRINHRYFGIVFVIITVLISSELFTSLLTHGIIVFLLFATFFLKDSE